MTASEKNVRTSITGNKSPAYDASYWVTIPGGPFTMGANAVQPDGKPGMAFPAHTVHVDTFQIGIGPVSVREFAKFVSATNYLTTAEQVGSSWVWKGDPSVRESGQDHLWFEIEGACWAHPRGPESDVSAKADHPVTHVSHTDCLAYCEWAGCRLPTEAEWEKAARGADGRRHTWGNSPPDPALCNYNMNVGDTTPIGSYPDAVGPFGLLDAAGNVWEWTSSFWQPYPFGNNEARTITTRNGVFELGVIRGGSFFNDFDDSGTLVYERVYGLRNYTSYDVGFRICRTTEAADSLQPSGTAPEPLGD